jgi:HSP20 family molecular chaperone IbpA
MLSENILDKLFNPTFNTMFESAYQRDDDGNIKLEIEVPGFNKDNLNVEISEGILTVEGKAGQRQIYKQYSIGNIEDIQATVKDGILSLKLIEQEKQVKRIALNTHQIEDQMEDDLIAVS